MTPDLSQEFESLSKKARQQLKNFTTPDEYHQVFSLWTMPSFFSQPSRCTINSPRSSAKGKQPFAEFNIWRNDLDGEKLRSPIERLKYPKELLPTIESDVVWLTSDEVQQIKQRIQGVVIPIFLGRPSSIVIDGTGFEFSYIGGSEFGVSLRWSCDLPQEWTPFTKIIMQIGSELEERRKKQAQEKSVDTER